MSHLNDGSNNEIRNMRPGSIFAKYRPETPEQQQALEQFQGIASILIQMASGFGPDVNPLEHAAMFVAAGTPGTGKTHLLEATVNAIKEQAPELLDYMFF